MNISVTSDVKRLTKKLTSDQRNQIPFAVSKALNALAFDIRNSVQLALPKYLENPTGYMSRGVQVEKSSKKKLVAKVGFRSRSFGKGGGAITQAEIMERHIKGGVRRPKGKALPVPVPANMKVNKFGNLPRGKISKLLADKDRYFSGIPRGMKDDGGIWERMPRNSKRKKPGGKVRMVVGWEPKALYKGGRFPFRKIAEGTIRTNFRKRFDYALRQALKTAR